MTDTNNNSPAASTPPTATPFAPRDLFAPLIAFARRHWPLAAMLAAMALAAALLRPDAALGLFRLEPPRQTTYSDPLDTDALVRRDAAIEGEFTVRDGAAALRPGGHYRITYSFEREPDERVFLMLRHFWRPYLTTQILITPMGGQGAAMRNPNLLGSPPVDLTPHLGTARKFQITLEARAAANAPDPAPVFDSITLRRTSDMALPDLPPLVFALVIALAAFHGAGRGAVRARLPHPAARYAGAVALFAVLVLASRFTIDAGQIFLWLAVAAAALLWLGEGRERLRALKPAATVELVTLLLVCGIALMLRWAALPAETGKQIEPDAQGYIAIAAKMAGPFQTDVREPALIWWVWLAQRLFVAHEAALRVMSCLLAVVIAALGWGVARRVMPAPLALGAALLVAVSQGFIAENLRGLRLEGYSVSLQLLALVLLWMPRRPKPSWIIGAGAAAGFAVLSNLAALSFCAPLLAYFGWRRRWRWMWWPLPFALMLALPAPYLMYCKGRFGDAFHSSNVHAVFYRNQEFKGRPGYPTIEEVGRDSYAGLKLTTAEYFFRHHSLGEIAGRSARGFLRLYAVSPEKAAAAGAPGGGGERTQWVSRARDLVFDGRGWLLALYLMGLAVAALRREWDLLVFYMAINLTSFFLAATPGIFFDPRLFLHYVPFACLFPPLALLAWLAIKDARAWWSENMGRGRRATKKEKATHESGKKMRPKRFRNNPLQK